MSSRPDKRATRNAASTSDTDMNESSVTGLSRSGKESPFIIRSRLGIMLVGSRLTCSNKQGIPQFQGFRCLLYKGIGEFRAEKDGQISSPIRQRHEGT